MTKSQQRDVVGVRFRQTLLIGGLVAFITMVAVALYVDDRQYDAAYAMPPRDFNRQSELIQPGMSLSEARGLLKHVTIESSYTSGTIHFALKPDRKSSWTLFPLLTYYINLTLDANGRVTKVSTSDG